MARKIKYKPKYNQPGLFDLAGDTGDVDTASPAPLPADDETPTAAGSEFDVRSVAPAKEAAAPSDPIELDASAIGRRDDIVFRRSETFSVRVLTARAVFLSTPASTPTSCATTCVPTA